PLFRQAPPAMRELIELAADATAARRCSSTALADALRVLSAAPPAAEGIAMANAAVTRRLFRLQSGPACRGSAVRTLWCTAAGLVATVLPAAVGLILLTSVACFVA
ncbi:hypothetical protein WB334_24890, partial [Escherichia coli]|uniref:hypothetical protein n=1 Tax=Escherichia coli TaxID=562 RepID=UPI0021580907